MYPQTAIATLHAFTRNSIAIGDEKFGSIKESRSSRFSNVTAIWTSEGGKIDVGSSLTPNPGQVLFYFEHCLSINGVNTPHIYANSLSHLMQTYGGTRNHLIPAFHPA